MAITSNKDLYYAKESVGQDYADDPYEFDFDSVGMMLVNDSTDDLFFSVNGKDDFGELSASDKSIVFDNFSIRKVWVRATAGATVDFRLWSWPET
jgi:hypothetical protein